MANFNLPTIVEDDVSIDLSKYRSPQAYFSAKPDVYGQKYSSIVEKQSGKTHAIGSNETLVSGKSLNYIEFYFIKKNRNWIE